MGSKMQVRGHFIVGINSIYGLNLNSDASSQLANVDSIESGRDYQTSAGAFSSFKSLVNVHSWGNLAKQRSGSESIQSIPNSQMLNEPLLPNINSNDRHTNTEVRLDSNGVLSVSEGTGNSNNDHRNTEVKFNGQGVFSVSEGKKILFGGVLSFGCDNSTQDTSGSSSSISVRIGKYTVEKELGSGGFGKVHQVVETDCIHVAGPRYAMKEMIKVSEGGKKMAKREADMLRPLKHVNIIQYVDAFSKGENFYILLEYANAGDLADMIDKQIAEKQQWNKLMILICFEQIVCGLNYLHSYRSEHIGGGILHRDLKPRNILVCWSPVTNVLTFKIGDFGLARVMDHSSAQANTFIGTRVYMSPEALNGEPYSFSHDVWALGCILYELCTLKRAFNKDVEIWRLAQNVKKLPVTIPTISHSASPGWDHWKELSCICSRILVRDPTRRPSCTKLLRKISRILVEEDRPNTVKAQSLHRFSRIFMQQNSDDFYNDSDDRDGDSCAASRKQKIFGMLVCIFLITVVVLVSTVLVLQPWYQDESDSTPIPSATPTPMPTPTPTNSPTPVTCFSLVISADLEVQDCSFVDGDITVSSDFAGDGLDIFTYVPNVTNVGGSLIVENSESIRAIRWSASEEISIMDSLIIRNSVSLESISFSNLVTVQGDVEIQNNEDLSVIEMPVLSTTGDFLCTENGLLAFDLPSLRIVNGELAVVRNNFLLSIELDRLATMTGSILNVSPSPAIRRINIPILDTRTLSVNTLTPEIQQLDCCCIGTFGVCLANDIPRCSDRCRCGGLGP